MMPVSALVARKSRLVPAVLRACSTARHLHLTSVTPDQTSHTTAMKSPTLYELRTYTVYPHQMKEFLGLTAQEIYLRTAHSKLLGYWTAEIGGLNQVVHLWEYGEVSPTESLDGRAQVRANLAADPEWLSRYVAKVIAHWQTQDNALLVTLPGTDLIAPENTGVYALQTFHLRGPRALWTGPLQAYARACVGLGATSDPPSTLVGTWRSVVGPRNLAVQLWHHLSPDCILPLQDKLDLTQAGLALDHHVKSGHSKLLLPTVVSPLQ